MLHKVIFDVPSYAYLSIIIGDGVNPIVAGTTGYTAPIPFSGTILGWTIAEVSPTPIVSTVSVDIWKDSSVNYPPTAADKISGSESPALSSGIIAVDTSLSTWTTDIDVLDCFGFTVASTDNQAKKLHITIYMTRNVS